MKKYDSIFIQQREMNDSEYIEASGIGLKEIPGPFIVLTPNDLWNMWAECAANQTDSETRIKNIGMFNRYLKTNGVEAEQLINP